MSREPQILHRDAALVAIDKPPGMNVIPGRGEDAGQPLVAWVQETLGQKVWVVHRIDRETSGLVLFALTAEAHKHLNRQFEAHSLKKRYLALVQGALEGSGEISAPLKQFGSGRMGIAEGGKPSLTTYQALERKGENTLVSLSPHTGRRHQLRVHMHALGHAILGDPLYGHDRPVGGWTRLMLHALSVELDHPLGGKWGLEAAVDADWQGRLAAI